MRSRTLLVAGAAGALALGAVGALVIAVSSGDGRPPSSPTPPAAPEPIGGAAEARAAPEPRPAPDAVPAADGARRGPLAADGPGAPAGTPWHEVPVSARASRLGPIAATVTGGLRAARARMERCFQEPRAPAAAGPEGDALDGSSAAPVLLLDLEEREGAVDVVDATVQRSGGDAALVACCIEELRGFSFPAPRAREGRRHRLRFVLR